MADLDDACDRLSRAILGYSSSHAKKLTRRIAASNFNFEPTTNFQKVNNSKSPQLLQLYHELEEICGDDKVLPKDIVMVYVELASLQKKARAKSSKTVSKNNSDRDNNDYYPTIVQQQQQQQEILIHEHSQHWQEIAQALTLEEGYVLRECLYALQGIMGDRIRWSEDENLTVDTPAVCLENLPPNLPSKLGSGALDAIRICGEAGWLYNRIQTYIQQQKEGSIVRAFRHALEPEMHSYRNTLAVLEERTLHSLRQLLAEIRAPIHRLRTIAMVTDGVQIIAGPKLLTALHLHSLHGDSRHSTLIHSLLAASSKPWFDMLFKWVAEGILMDPYNEFYIRETEEKETANLWREKYQIDESKIPVGVADQEMIEASFILGKGINFIRKCLLDNTWANEGVESVNKDGLGFYYIPSINRHARQASFAAVQKKTLQVHAHILESLRTDYNLSSHLHGMKQFLLLGQGDFFANLVDSLHQEYAEHQGIVGVYRHTLSAIVDASIKSTNACELPQFVLDSLQVEVKLDKDEDVRFMFGHSSTSKNDQRTVWDIFTLEYVLSEPLKAIVHSEMMSLYNRMFDFLFSLKRAEFMLNQTWRESATLHHALQRTAQYNAITVQSSQEYSQATILLRRIAMARQAMSHFVVNFKSYLMFEVLEGGWNEFKIEMDEANTLDEMIEAHENYMYGVTRRSLLDIDGSGRRICLLVRRQLEVVREFCLYQDELFGDALAAAERVSKKREEAERRLDDGDWGFQSEQDIVEEQSFFGLSDPSKLDQVDSFGTSFDTNMILILESLNRELHTGTVLFERDSAATPSANLPEIDNRDDQDALRFLTFQLNHNAYYEIQDR